MLLLACLFVGISLVTAQTQKVTGVVISEEDGQPVVGASVLVKGTTQGTITDVDGNFNLSNVPSSAKTLQISYIGMQTQEVAIKPTLKVVLKSDAQQIDEVMVVAYGTAKKASFTGAASTVKGDKVLKDIPVTSFEEALSGTTPGLTINSTSGQPGAGLQIRVRGTGSMNASNEPLYVIDGVPVVSGDIAISAVTDDSKAFNVMSSINPSDIENITVLKDAAAASLYGSRAANGVILITTKHGKAGKTRVNFKANWGFSDWAMKNRKSVNGQQRHELTYEACYNEATIYGIPDDDGNYTGPASEAEAKAYAQEMADFYADDKYDVDWEDAFFRKHGSSQNYEFSAQGGDERNSFFASLAYKKEEGKSRTSSLDGFMGRINAVHRSANNKWQMGANISMSRQSSSVSSEGTAYANPFFLINYVCTPNMPIYDDEGNYYTHPFLQQIFTHTHPVEDINLDKNESKVFRSFNNLWASYQFIEGLTLKQSISYDYVNNNSITYWPLNSNNGTLTGGLRANYPMQQQNSYSSTTLNYVKTFGQKHNLDALIGWDVDDRRTEYVFATSSGYPHDKLPESINAATPEEGSAYYTEDHLLSLLSRVNYDYDNKYYASVNFRRDGSSRLGANNRWANFWSVSAAWRLTQEDFMKGITQINDLKVRASYGINGTLPRDLYGHLSLYGYGYNYQSIAGSAPKSVPNPDLSWEKNKNFNIGFDASLFDRLNISFDYYSRRTSDLLQNVPTSMAVGFKTMLKNVGEMTNRGVELDINVDVFKHTQVKWNTGLALSHNSNKVSKLYEGKDIIDGTSIIREGESYYSWWSREWAGVDPATGEEQWVLNTKNADGSLNKELTKNPAQAQRVVIGKPDPKLTGGWRNSVSWKGLELNLLFNFSLGGKIFDTMRTSFTDTDGYVVYYNSSVDQLDRWQKPGDVTSVPRRINNYEYGNYGSSRFMKDLNYLRLKSMSLSYTLPAQLTRRAQMENVRLFISGSNLLTWTSYKNVDPEQPINGIPTFAFPNLKSVTLGIEIGF
ncbi:tonB-dependent receptor plug domain protein [Bacteroides sp. CAG:754]|nr:tonB-dependent receptor plug domain protein [Bacteroides sp. CAG:754]